LLSLTNYAGASMNLFGYNDYKKYVNDWIDDQPSNGHGQLRQMSLHLQINSVVMSQVFRGDRDITLEQALELGQFIGFTDIERDYFLLLVQKARAGTEKLKKVLQIQIETLATSALSLKNRIKHQKFSDEDKAVFYSHWYFSAVRLGVSLPHLNNISSLAEYLDLDRALVSKVFIFLLKNKLIVENEKGFDMGPQVTHVGHDSPFVNRHHSNWRIQALRAMEKSRETNLFYTGPMALSNSVAKEIHQTIVDLIEKSTKKVAASDSETLRCLNIDWFEVR
jgi:uncharacterized protein (TIGR02147 family)